MRRERLCGFRLNVMAKAAQTAPLDGGLTRLAVVVRGGRNGDRAVAAARELADAHRVQIVLVALVPHARNVGCTISAEPLNDAVESAALEDLAAAARSIGDPACARAVLRTGVDASLADWAVDHGVTTVLLPGRGARVARALAAAGLEVRCV